MQYATKILVLSSLVFAASCGSKSSDNSALSEKKAKLEELKKQQATIASSISNLESEIAKTDPSTAKTEKAKLVTVATLAPESFTHFIDLQGKIESDNISYVTPRNGQGGQVKAVYVKKGDVVHKGQLLLKLDDAIAKQSLITAEQAIQTTQTQLNLAQDIYKRKKNLWDQGIGTEVDLINSKSNVESLQSQLKTQQEQLKITKEQLGFTNVYSDVDGVADDVNVRVGEFFQGINPAGGSQIKIVNISKLKATAQVPENYIDRVKVGNTVKITLPDINKTISSNVAVAGKLIDANSRSFYIESKIPADKDFRPNQIALVKIQDYSTNHALTVPVNTLQSDDKGRFVMVAVKEGSRLVAKKKRVEVGMMYQDKLEILQGLQSGDQVITDGYQALYDGQLITTETK
jgi:RND family efflux transporter MFP subunit